MKQPARKDTAQRRGRGGGGWIFLVAVLVAAGGAALDFSAPHGAGGWDDRAGAPSLIGLGCALACGLAARLMRLVLGRTERTRPP